VTIVQPAYPTIQLIARFGDAFATITAALPLAGAIVCAIAGAPWWVLPAGAVMSGDAFVFLRSYVELIRAVADTLLPR
jgi:carbon starvation protein CstA